MNVYFLVHGTKRCVCLYLFYNVCFSSKIHGDPTCWNEKNEVKKEDMEAKQWKKKGGQILKGSKTVTYNIISSEKSKII